MCPSEVQPSIDKKRASQQAVPEVVKKDVGLQVEMLRDGRLFNTSGVHPVPRGVANAKHGLAGCIFGFDEKTTTRAPSWT
jgi:hypothetical protein